MAPGGIDWRTKGVVPPVANQGAMGASTVAAAVDLLDMVHAVEGGELVQLSTAMASDCCGSQQPLPCIVRLGGLCTAADYPSPRGTCAKSSCKPAFSLAGWKVDDVQKTVPAMRSAVERAPVMALVEADTPPFMEYTGGVFNSTSCGQRLDHAVTIVGYEEGAGAVDSEAYWIVRNSWGATWGEKGYIRIAMNDANICGIMSAVSSITPT